MQTNFRNALIVILAALLLFVVSRAQSPAEGEPAKVAAKATIWEYQKIHPDRDLLDSLGREGWEVCAAYTDINASHVILKRAKIGK